MDRIVVHGGARLEGTVTVSGSKNSTLALMASALLAEGETVLHNVPRVRDVDTMLQILGALGARGRWDEQDPHTLRITSRVTKPEAPYDLVRKMRASFLVLGPLVARFGAGRVSEPGGCAIGVRPVDQHLKGLEALGACVRLDHGYVEATSEGLRGARVVSHHRERYPERADGGDTANGESVLENAAREPEVIELARALVAMGARIQGAGTDRIVVRGVPRLRGIAHRVAGDRIEAGTLLAAGVITQGDVTVAGVEPETLETTLEKLRETGALVEVGSERIRVRAEGPSRAIRAVTAPYPGLLRPRTCRPSCWPSSRWPAVRAS